MLADSHLHVSGEVKAGTLLSYMDGAGLDRAIFLGSSLFTLTLDHRDGFVNHSDNNTHLLRLARSHSDRLAAWPTLDPREPQNAWRVMCYAEQGASGIKLYAGHGACNAITGEPIFHVCRLNCGIAGYWSELLRVLYRYPDLKFVIPHFALSTRAPDRLRFLLERFPNVLTDTSFGQDEFLLAGSIRVGQSSQAARAGQCIQRAFPVRDRPRPDRCRA